ncbi:MAG TPA: hypothetical protein VGA78_15025 [Gemmatimonadales bacterium]
MNALPRFSKALRAGTAVTLLLPLMYACADEPVPLVVEFRPDCPYEGAIRFQDSAGQEIQAYTELAVPGSLTMTPEYHDCQRFILPGSPTYGPLVAIFAAERLGELIDSLEFLDQTQTSLLAMPVAQILSFDGDYASLGILRGHNCVYLWKKAATYDAYVLPVQNQQRCAERHPPNALPAGGTPLTVQVRTRPDPPFNREDYPDVARWDRDVPGQQQGMALGCGKGWCEIGPTGYAAVPSHDWPALPKEHRRTVVMKGWYDEQPLADSTPAGLLVSSVIGTIFPHPDLRNRTLQNYDSTWTEAAYVTLSAPLPKYKTRLNLDAGNLPARQMNVISLCRGPRSSCGVPPQPSGATTCKKAADPWWARIISVQQDTAYRCVIRRVHPGLTIPGAVRWRWSPDDEIGWIRCPEGCCEMTGDS